MKTTVNEKAAALQERFYPIVAANLADITDPTLAGEQLATELRIDCTAAEWEVYKALKALSQISALEQTRSQTDSC